MGDDDEHICTACGRQKQNHALSVRADGVIVAASIIDSYGDWTECCAAEIERLQSRLKVATDALEYIVHRNYTGAASVACDALTQMSVVE